MSNIPEPPLINTSQTTHNSNRKSNSRRGRGPGKGGNSGDHAEPANRDSTKPSRHPGYMRQREPKQHSMDQSENVGMVRIPHNHAGSTGNEDESYSKRQNSSLGPRRNYNTQKGENHVERHTKPAVKAVTGNQARTRHNFGSRLTEQLEGGHLSLSRRPTSLSPDSDLATRLTFTLRAGPPHPDCPICFNPVYPGQPTWSCSLSVETTTCCWAFFHLKCVREWANKSTQETKAAFAARGEAREGEWRCPGCQTKRSLVPHSYVCFCGGITNPQPGISTPHSCGMSCSRKRTLCEHPCSLNCHPGPCPPCVLTVNTFCYCAKTTLSIRCSHFHGRPSPSLSCGQPCGRKLSCGLHLCEAACHSQDCEPCELKETIKCYCGKHSKQVDCGEMAERVACALVDIHGDKTLWEGRFNCEFKCERPFACGSHICSETCHPPSASNECPFDPSIVTHCPCGKKALRELSGDQRARCTDPIQTCSSLCGKSLEGCPHRCSTPCHLGACPPCSIPVTVFCRCGMTTRNMACHEHLRDIAQGTKVILCDKPCEALRLCGRHQCSRICCPLARIKAGKGKKRPVVLRPDFGNSDLDDTERLWHECDLVCGKTLGCGSHKCQEADHRGPCPPCLRSSFEESTCHCGGTVLLPPVPCGKRLQCTLPCNRPPPPCGHDLTVHPCHEDPDQCPPCPFLTTKSCACGKSNINNVRCSQEKVSCGQPCGKLLDCGFHRCQKLCHNDDCGACSSVCGKPRKLCLPSHHPCTLPCHAPSACNESEACEATVTISCPCGRLQQPMKCSRCDSNVGKTVHQLQCRDECNIAKRNARLAEALGLPPEVKEKTNVAYSEDLLAFGKANAKFIVLVEKTLNDFVTSDKKTQVLPYMPESRRKFVRELCHLYRIDTRLVDHEPRRSIQLYRRLDSRTPSPQLSTLLSSQNIPNLGKLTDLRIPPMRTTSTTAPPSVGSSPTRWWTSVVSSNSSTGSIATSSASANMPTAMAVSSKPQHLPPHTTGLANVRENWEED